MSESRTGAIPKKGEEDSGNSLAVRSGVRLVLAALLLAAGSWLLGEQLWLEAKGALAAELIDRSFEAHLVDGRVHHPWSWADIHPVARLEVPRLGIRRAVLSGASGSSLAFGLGHVDGTSRPNGKGNSVIAGHRDSWSAFLKDLEIGDKLLLQTREGKKTYKVNELAVVSRQDGRVLQPSHQAMLTLVTCYPFDGLLHSPWRYVVAAN